MALEGDPGPAQALFLQEVRPLVGRSGDPEEEALLPLRNLLAHGGGMTRDAARRLLEEAGHERRALALLRTAREWLEGQRLLFMDPEGGGVELQGPQPRRLAPEELGAALEEHPGQVVLVEPEGGILNLWPLFGFGLPEVVRAGRRARRGSEPVPQVYVRADPSFLLYNALGGDLPFCQRSGDALECFQRVFRVERKGPARPGRALADFEEELAAAAQERVGREAELEALVEALLGATEGVLWLSGPAGMGKSVLMASLARHERLMGDPRKLLVIAHRFKVGDARCSAEAFLRQAVHHLQGWEPLRQEPAGGQEPVEPGTADPHLLARRFRELLERAGTLAAPSDHPLSRPPRVLLLVDGLDEIARLEPGFASFPLEHQTGQAGSARLLVDADGPVSGPDPWTHLKARDNWDRPDGSEDDDCHLMVQVMESWFLADRETLARHFGPGFNAARLPGQQVVEDAPKRDVLAGLVNASRESRRGAYDKGRDSFELLASIDPSPVESRGPWAQRFIDHL